MLKCGISAEKLASIERISTEQVQLYFYKLSILGLVAPARRDDQWAQLDAVLETKSTPLRLSEESGSARLSRPTGGVAPWRPNESASGDDAINRQRAIAHLIELAAQEENSRPKR